MVPPTSWGEPREAVMIEKCILGLWRQGKRIAGITVVGTSSWVQVFKREWCRHCLRVCISECLSLYFPRVEDSYHEIRYYTIAWKTPVERD